MTAANLRNKKEEFVIRTNIVDCYPNVMTTLNSTNDVEIQSTTPNDDLLIRSFVQDDLESVKDLFISYHQWLNLDLHFQEYEKEFTSLPGRYAIDQGGSLFLAFNRKFSNEQQSYEPIGCLAMRKINITEDVQSSIKHHLHTLDIEESFDPTKETRCCELKRMFVKPSARGMKVGNSLIITTLEYARKQGYKYAFLDTLPDRMQGANTLYKRFGFTQTIPYYQSPLQDQTHFLIKRL